MSPVDWALRPVKRYSVLSGRAPRAEYWWYVLAVSIVGMLVELLDARLTGPVYGEVGPLALAFTLAFLVPGVSVAVRRLHDTDRSGWWVLVKTPGYALSLAGGTFAGHADRLKQLPASALAVLVAVFFVWAFAALAVFIFEITPGTEGPNRFGPDPCGRGELEEVFA